MAAMNQLRSALQLYVTDQGGYPPQLLGYVTLYTTGPMTGNVMPANELKSYLYPKRVGALTTFQPAYNTFEPLDTTTAVYPLQDARAVGTAPVMDLDGDGDVDNADDIPEARQQFGPADGCVRRGGGVVACNDPAVALFYSVSGYDVARVRDGAGGFRMELHYTLFWTEFALSLNGSSFDDPRQLGYNNPPDDAIITWNSHFRNYTSGGALLANNREILLYVGGSAKPANSGGVSTRSWRYEVNP
jgi:hypothetical protein